MSEPPASASNARPASPIAHRMQRMSGRDPRERGRVATPLELLFDLTFVAAIGLSAYHAAHVIAEGHLPAALSAFAFSTFAIVWAWINFTWFASAFDTDDWFYRVTTMVQMIGVLVLAVGVPRVYESIDAGEPIDNSVLVSGYIVMRVAMAVQWFRVAVQQPQFRRSALCYGVGVMISQIGWVVVAFLTTIESMPVYVALWVSLIVIEMAVPVLAERQGATPWHPHHIAERYGLFVIIALGEGVLGTVAVVVAVVEEVGWSPEAVGVMVAGTGLTFGIWWMHFAAPFGELLERRPARAFVWGYGHIPLIGAIAGVGAGLHVAALVVGGRAAVGVVGAVGAVAVPVAAYLLCFFLLYSWIAGTVDPLNVLLAFGALCILALAVVTAATGAGLGASLLLTVLAPAVVVVGYEIAGRRRGFGD